MLYDVHWKVYRNEDFLLATSTYKVCYVTNRAHEMLQCMEPIPLDYGVQQLS